MVPASGSLRVTARGRERSERVRLSTSSSRSDSRSSASAALTPGPSPEVPASSPVSGGRSCAPSSSWRSELVGPRLGGGHENLALGLLADPVLE